MREYIVGLLKGKVGDGGEVNNRSSLAQIYGLADGGKLGGHGRGRTEINFNLEGK